MVKGEKIIVPAGQPSTRLDKFLIQQFPDTHRKFWKENLTQIVRVNGKPAKSGNAVRGGDRIQVDFPEGHGQALQPRPELPLKILFKDAFLIAVDKPAGLPCHPLKATELETVANALLAKFPELRGLGSGELEAGLIHRLDNETSGVLLFARTPEAWRKFATLNRGGKLDKFYLAWVTGRLDGTGKIRLAVAHHPSKKNRMVAVAAAAETQRLKGRPALSEYDSLQAGENSLLRVKIHKGSRHQIRVHLASLGHPIVGDKLYGGRAATQAPRHLLHAERVEFTHPFSGKKIIIESPVPEDFTQFEKGSLPPPPGR